MKLKFKYKALIAVLVVAMICAIGIIAFEMSARISLTNYEGDISAKRSYKLHIEPEENIYLEFTEEALFASADYVIYGSIKKIRQIEIDCAGEKVYMTLITVETLDILKGNCDKSEIVISALPIGLLDRVSTEGEMLLQLKKGDAGIFLVNAVAENQMVSQNSCTFDLSELCDATFYDGMRFGFVFKKSSKDKALCCDNLSESRVKVFDSLQQYDRESIFAYVRSMIE